MGESGAHPPYVVGADSPLLHPADDVEHGMILLHLGGKARITPGGAGRGLGGRTSVIWGSRRTIRGGLLLPAVVAGPWSRCPRRTARRLTRKRLTGTSLDRCVYLVAARLHRIAQAALEDDERRNNPQRGADEGVLGECLPGVVHEPPRAQPQ
jgi:hypothetical protein